MNVGLASWRCRHYKFSRPQAKLAMSQPIPFEKYNIMPLLSSRSATVKPKSLRGRYQIPRWSPGEWVLLAGDRFGCRLQYGLAIVNTQNAMAHAIGIRMRERGHYEKSTVASPTNTWLRVIVRAGSD